ncbi:DUF6371 domain-containing protein [Proteiniphilum propionicum]|uniref:DUF6371 domain-containing protein n=1 Tax=Proteiniphilum propionicum TaxID=2829812 RepID=UPI001EEC29BD|nr:DUF6371 domain-containing protein [Proteiniphilum propionicum]ULB35440.1 hypothetical protein KDN43_05230 [Proteiniphilum propionicum]
MFKPPYLQKYAGKSTRFTCPGCKTPYSFTRYLDGETLQPIHATVGRCNREIKCGYHYTPRQYFSDLKRQDPHFSITQHHGSPHWDLHSPVLHNHGDANWNPNASSHPAPPQTISDTITSPSNLSQHQKQVPKISNHLTTNQKEPTGPHLLHTYLEPSEQFSVPQPNQPVKPPDFIPHKYLKRSLSLNSNFVRFLSKHFSDLQIAEAANNYLLGATRNGEVIFWQIDINGKVRTGKIMQYNSQTGRRIKTGYGGINWVHHKLKKSNPSFSDFNLSQCYFGEHLLRLYPDKPIAIVEAEKTAVIASMIYHNYNWLAAGNLNGLNVEKSRVLQNKTVILYPDVGCYDRWLKKAEQINLELSLHLIVSDFLENFANPQQTHLGYDIADYIIEKKKIN